MSEALMTGEGHIRSRAQIAFLRRLGAGRKISCNLRNKSFMISFELDKTPCFDITATLECGQVFRFSPVEGGYVLHALSHVAKIIDRGDSYEVSADDEEFFKAYFDLDRDYAAIQSELEDGGTLSEAIAFGRGIHILKQDPIEAIFSFIVSQNNHIPRIKGIIERMCDALGEDMGDYHAFPSLKALAGAGEEFYASIGAGYRAAYLDRVAKAMLDINLDEWRALDTESLRRQLMAMHGIGRKVADCILLFGFDRFDVFPVDTWIKKVFADAYPDMPADKMSTLLVQKYGQYSGFVQQWLFYFKRTKKTMDKSNFLS